MGSNASIATCARARWAAVMGAALATTCGPARSHERDADAVDRLEDASRDDRVEDSLGVDASADAMLDGDASADAREQGVLSVVVFRVPENTPADASLHLAGTFNGWNPGDPAARLSRDEMSSALVLRLRGLTPGQRIECKFTRGSWGTVERDDRGRDIDNRVITFDPSRPTVALFIERWADLAAPAHTRSGDVRVLRDVPIPELARARDVWLYLPPGYERSTRRYPVLYMFDGQNVFDARSSAFGAEWQVDEALEAMYFEGRTDGVIVAALANSDQRPCEYNVFASDPHPACADGSALGDRTIAFVADTLKPMIDRAYRTRPEREQSAVMGSSMGGSMAVRLGFSRAAQFARVAALSPSYQNTLAATPAMPDYVRAQRPPLPFRLYQDIGSIERIRDLPPTLLERNMRAVHDAARGAGVPEDALRAQVIDGAIHDEAAWARRVPAVLEWLWR
jgi:predicted alpha/beta superfamily hydrolase